MSEASEAATQAKPSGGGFKQRTGRQVAAGKFERARQVLSVSVENQQTDYQRYQFN
ncbi:MAG: hypothetical protein VYA84_18795 [Planctomycetota bacterium]|nr:hypothetical protein [Planctomycetota bacterium]